MHLQVERVYTGDGMRPGIDFAVTVGFAIFGGDITKIIIAVDNRSLSVEGGGDEAIQIVIGKGFG